jgi:tetratricopeptide (TPR) repeat protein
MRALRFTEQSKALQSSAVSETKLGRPASAPRLNRPASAASLNRPASAASLNRPASAASSAAGLQASRGFSASLSTLPRSKARPQTSSGVRSTAATADPSEESEESLFELRDLPALAAGNAEVYVLPGSVGERLAHEMRPPAQQARRKGTQAWVQGDVQRAIQEFSSAIDLEPVGSRARTDALQLRCAGLLRAGRHAEALEDAQIVVQALQGFDGAGGLASVVAEATGSSVPGRSAVAQAKLAAAAAAAAEYKVAAWQLHGLALSGCERHAEAAASFARALGLRPDTPHAAALTRQFLDAASACKTTGQPAALPLSVYLVRGTNARATLRLAPERSPVFRLLLRPRFPPWPLELNMMGLMGRIADPTKGGGGGGGGGSGADTATADAGDADAGDSDARTTRFSMFCAFQQMPAEPHMCVAL